MAQNLPPLLTRTRRVKETGLTAADLSHFGVDASSWCFDLLEINGRGLRRRGLIERRAMLRHLINRADDHVLRFSETFPDPTKLLKVANAAGLEGIVSKLRSQPYCSGRNPGWIKVKCRARRAANRDRREMFEKRGA
jgi:ATP-dependent DNA ligase